VEGIGPRLRRLVQLAAALLRLLVELVPLLVRLEAVLALAVHVRLLAASNAAARNRLHGKRLILA
jgi:hypothetical protein